MDLGPRGKVAAIVGGDIGATLHADGCMPKSI